jgi:hypothetical protein
MELEREIIIYFLTRQCRAFWDCNGKKKIEIEERPEEEREREKPSN